MMNGSSNQEQVQVAATMTSTIMPRIAVIGAGPSGITAAKNVLQAGLGDGLVVFEATGDVGGNWVYRENVQHSSVYETTYTISSRYLSEFEDFPFPADASEYLPHKYLCSYFQQYAKEFDVTSKVRFYTRVVRAQRHEESGLWHVESRDLDDASFTETFDYLMVANGHHWDPRMPSFQGNFEGQIIHSHSFKHNRPFRNKRVLIVGGGNSACDVAVECSRVAKKTCLSMRRGHWFIPKFMFGIPTDFINASLQWLPVPLCVRNFAYRLLIWFVMGSHRRLGLQTPTYNVLEGHVTLNSELAYHLGHGSIIPQTGIDRVDGRTVHFSNGQSDEFDTIICATGYNISFPFFSESFINWKDSTYVPLWRRMFHPTVRNLYFIGLFQPLGPIWPLADYQGMLACQEILGHYQRPTDMAAAIEQQRRNPHYKFIEAPRHSTEVDYHKFRNELLHELKKCGKKPHRKNPASSLVDRLTGQRGNNMKFWWFW
jgi:hypothetical protein